MTGTPAIVMSALPGTIVWEPPDTDEWLRRLAEMLPVIHATPVVPELTDWAPYPAEPGLVLPPWTRHPDAWQTALDLYAGPRPPAERVFVHRDFHPGNVLWTGGRISGIVDWMSSCVEPPEEDVAHCRANLAQHHGQAEADGFSLCGCN